MRAKIETIIRHTFINNLDKDSVVVDLGANKGDFSKGVAEKAGCSRIILVEGNPGLARELESSFRGQGHFSVVSAVMGGQARAHVSFYLSGSPGSSSLRESFTGPDLKREIKTKMITLKDIFSMFGLVKIDLLKMDVEGAEWDVFEKFSKEDFDRIEQITVEFHDFKDPSSRRRTEGAIDKMKGLGYCFVNKTSGYRFKAPYKDCLFYKRGYRLLVLTRSLRDLADAVLRDIFKLPFWVFNRLNPGRRRPNPDKK
ncbi:MAG: FkbM family methyltransferase [Candidatus Omnitrophota bacterium]